jgi:membrane protease YdiL (CAAX protease family)
VLGNGVIIGWLLLAAVEGRSLFDMGWRRKRAWAYALAGAAVPLLVAMVWQPPSDWGGLKEVLPPQRGVVLLKCLPGSFMLGALILGAVAGWLEENLFRGHLMLALQEAGLTGAVANIAQAGLFTAYHLPAYLLAEWQTATTSPGWTALFFAELAWFAAGLVFGALRSRSGSIIPGFALHASWDAVHVMLRWGPIALVVHGLR